MVKSIEVTLTSYQTEPAAKACGRILVSKDNLLFLTGALESGRLCIVEKIDGDGSSVPVRREASLWASPDPLRRNLGRVSKVFREACGFGSAEKCRITFAAENGLDAVPEAAEVVVEDVTKREGLEPVASDPEKLPLWMEHIEEQLDAAEVVFPGMILRDVKRRRTRRDFAVKTVNGETNKLARFCVDQTKVRFPSHSLALRPASSSVSATGSTAMVRAAPQRLQVDPIVGLESTVELLNEFLLFLDPTGDHRVPGESCAVVLQGDTGTGKTMLLKRLAALDWGRAYHIQPGEKLSAIQDIFTEAAEHMPSMITIDNIEKLLSEERANRAAVIQLLSKLLDQLAQAAVTGPQLVVIVTCTNYTRDIPAELRQPGRLDDSITIPFPDTETRQAILRSFDMPLPPASHDAMIRELSLKTHAFNGHELRSLFYKASKKKRARIKETGDMAQQCLIDQDFDVVLQSAVPARMDGINIKPRPVYWHQIHGQAALVEALQSAVDMLNDPEEYASLLKSSPRGFLLYGPPGCSKTMTAQALATESGLNYFSVKGGELLNQYVGESERGIRELFERAKRAAPAVIFLDEIDAVAGRRSDFGDKSASSNRGPQVVPALLSELDGFETLSKVFVVAATNRPESLDPALLRPGRLERHFYVPPPNEQARRAILQTWAQGMSVSPEFDMDHLARLTDKFSGAELVGICHEVGLAAVMKKQKERKVRPDAEPVLLTTEMFEDQIRKTKKMITAQMLDFFSTWSVSY
ncbi:aaa family ATPase [Grosmannia clavigera kw1407]|uniref:Aaa family ATPase n=1 Tax=Grosmannia clavigera (strain kw1407 / UAMH 11150) TaxID=655863 RepID=F0XHX3_GROCL|nr:aaa family ATPase [Grosmannia clavigera kw1407]EFX02828.1 aaa family ATPase [Grosmannia clavigera kw1407]